MRYYATIKNAEIKDGCILRSEHGNGHTPESAIEDYVLVAGGQKRMSITDPQREDGLAVLVIDVRENHAIIKMSNCGLSNELLKAIYESDVIKKLFKVEE
jgi:hypothetical protein